ncbi:MAG: hypothetical protein WDO56_08415 [Gammaproteobacteria bacterium]
MMNAARNISRDQIEETLSMETRISKLESVVAQIKDVTDDVRLDVRNAQGDIKAANGAIATLKTEVDLIGASLPHLENNAYLSNAGSALVDEIGAVETRIIRWFVFTAVAIAALTFSIAKFVS